jgi:anaerobic selenocysteine-containing dehydrogenase
VVLFDVARGCVAAYYPEANVLTGRDADPRSHTPAFKSCPVSITPAPRDRTNSRPPVGARAGASR